MLKKLLSSKQGFTLIEIVATLTIIVVILSIAAGGVSRLNSRADLNLVANNLVSDLRNTAMSALSSEQYQLQATDDWGIHLISAATETPTYYIIFADLNDDKTYNLNEKVKTVTLSKNIELGCISFNSACDAYGDIVFSNETGIPYFNTLRVTSTTGNAEITLTDNVTAETETISINTLGAVTIE